MRSLRAFALQAIVIACALCFFTLTFVSFFNWNHLRVDAYAYWDAAMHLRHGEALYATAATSLEKVYLYPPAFAALFAPLTLLPTLWGFALWMAIELIAIAVLIKAALILANVRADAKPARCFFYALAGATLLSPLIANVQEGQVNIVVVALVALAWISLEEDRARATGLCLALATHIKLVPAILVLPLLVWRKRAATRWFAIGLVAFAFLPLVWLQPRLGLFAALRDCVALHRAFATHVLWPGIVHHRVAGAEQFHVPNDSWLAVLMRIFGNRVALSAFPGAKAGPLWFALPRPLIAALAFAIGGIMIACSLIAIAWKHVSQSAPHRNVALALLYLAAAMTHPSLWEHHLILIVLLLAASWRLLRDDQHRERRLLTIYAPLLLTLLLPFVSHLRANVGGRAELALAQLCETWGARAFALLWVWIATLALFSRERSLEISRGRICGRCI